MSATIIGIDPHKRSHTAVVLDDCEEIVSQIRVAASSNQVPELVAWAPPGDRVWAVENANGLGRLLAQQLVLGGETVVDVPATLAARARKLSGHSARKTDEFDARSVAIAAAHNRGLRSVDVENVSAVLGLLVDRRWQLVSQRQRATCQLHALLTELITGGADKHLTSKKAAALLRTVSPGTVVELERKLIARELQEDIRALDRRIPAANKRLTEALTSYGHHADRRPRHRRRRRGHDPGDRRRPDPLPDQGSLRRVHRHRAAGRVLGRCSPAAPIAARQPPAQLGPAHRREDPDPPRRARPRLLRTQARRTQKHHGSAARTQAAAVRRRLPPPAHRPPGAGGPGWTDEDETEVRVTDSHL